MFSHAPALQDVVILITVVFDIAEGTDLEGGSSGSMFTSRLCNR